MDMTNPNDFVWARDPIFVRVESALASPTSSDKTVEALFSSYVPMGSAVLDRKIFLSVFRSLNAGIPEQLVDMLAGQLLDGTSQSVNMQRFYKVYHALTSSSSISAPISMPAATQQSATAISTIQQEQGRQKVLERLAKYMKERRVDSVGDLFVARVEQGVRTISASDFEIFMDKSFPDLFFDDKEAFLAAFRLPASPRLLSFEQLQAALGQHQTPATFDELMEELRLAAVASFVDIVELFKQYDTGATGQVSSAEFEFGLKKIRVNISNDNMQRLFSMLDASHSGRIAYADLARQLEEYSTRHSNVSPSQPIFSPIQQVREALRAGAGPAFHSTLQPYVTSSSGGKKEVGTRDLRGCLARACPSLADATCDLLIEFLDPARRGVADYEQFCELLGYIQGRGMQLTSRFAEQTSASFGPKPVSEGSHKKNLNMILVQAGRTAAERRISLASVFQDFDFRKEMCLTPPDFAKAIAAVLPINAEQLAVVTEFFPMPGRSGIDYTKFCKTVEEAAFVGRIMTNVFLAFDRLNKMNKSAGLSALLAKWDRYGTRTLARSDMAEILNNMCSTRVRDDEVEMIVRYYDTRGNGTMDLDALEEEYMNSRLAAKPGPGILMRALKEYCDYHRTTLETAIRKQFPTSGDYLNRYELQKFFQEICKGRATENAVAYGFHPLTEFRPGEISLREFLQLYEDTNRDATKAEQGQKDQTMDAVADKAVELGVDLEQLIGKADRSYERTLSKENILQLLNNYLMLGYEASAALVPLLGEYDKEATGKIKYDHFLADLKPHVERKRRIQEYIAGLKAHLRSKGLRLRAVFSSVDLVAKGSLSRDAVALAIEKTGYVGDRTVLRGWLDSVPSNHDGEIPYTELEAKVESEPAAAVAAAASGVPGMMMGNDYFGKMAADMGRAAEKERVNLAERLADSDYARNGHVAVDTFVNTLRFLHVQGCSESDLQAIARKYANPAGDAVQYKHFLADVAIALGKESGLSSVRANLQWANRVLDEFAVALHSRKENVTTYFTGYGLNPLNNTITYPGFAQGIRALKIKASEKEIEQLSKDLDVQYDKTVSMQTLHSVIESRQADAVHRYGREISRQLYDCIKSKRVDLAKAMKKYDAYNMQEIATFDFEHEIRIIMGANLTDSQYAFLVAKYEKRPGKADYGALIRELESARGLESVTNFYASHPARVQLVDRLRDRIRTKNLRVASMLLGMDMSGTKIFPNKVLYDVFPKELLSTDDYEELVAVLDEKRAGNFHFDSMCSLFWTNQDEEDFRSNAASNAEALNKKISSFCQKHHVDLESRFVKADSDGSGYLTSDEMKNVFSELGMPLSHRQLAALLYYQDLGTDGKWRKNYVDLAQRILGGVSTIAQRFPQIGKGSGKPEGKHVRFADDPVEESHKNPRTEATPSFQAAATGLTRAQRDVLTKLDRDLRSNNVTNLRDQFRAADPSELLYLSKGIFFETFGRLRISLTPEEQQTLLELPHVVDPQDPALVYYEQFVKAVDDFRNGSKQAPEEPRWSPEAKTMISPARETKLDDEMIDYVANNLAIIRDYLKQNGVDIEKEFGKYERDGYLDFIQFCQVLYSHNVETLRQDVADAFYSYLKEEREGQISMKRLYESMIGGKKLTQYKSSAISGQESAIKSQIVASGLHFKRLFDYMKLHDVSIEVFKSHSTGGRTLTKAQLATCFSDIKYDCPSQELDVLFSAIDLKGNGEGSVPHLVKLVSERAGKREEKKLALDEKSQAVLDVINKEVIEKNVTLNQFYKALDVNGDGYVDRNEFVNGLVGKLQLRITPEAVADLFKALDVDG